MRRWGMSFRRASCWLPSSLRCGGRSLSLLWRRSPLLLWRPPPLLLPLCLCCCLAWCRTARAERTAFYYGPRVPRELIAAYDQVVVEPDHIGDLAAFAGNGARPIAYLSIGEVARGSRRSGAIDRAWVLAENGAWSSWVMDLENPAYQAYLLRRADELWAQGYRGFFLDTLDSYRLAADESRDEGLRRALVHIIRSLGERHPGVRLLVNRGFEVLPEVRPVLSGVVAESLFDRWDAATQSYRRVPENDRRWLERELSHARDRLGLPVTVIDYRPPNERAEARDTARRIAALGFEPWVTNAALDDVGIGSLEILPRRVLILTNDAGSAVSDAQRLLAPVLEYLGYVPEHRRVPAAWSEFELDGSYQGVITWFSSSRLPAGYADWLHRVRQRGLRLVMFGVPGLDLAGADARALGLSLVAPASAAAVHVSARDALVGFEAEPPPRPFDGPLLEVRRAPGTFVHLRLTDSLGRSGDAVATTGWGGFALSHMLALRGLGGERAWVIDPVGFLRRALALPDAPLPTVTTSYGRRVALFVVRPEGLSANVGGRSAASVLGEWLGERQRWPHSLALPSADQTQPAAEGAGASLAADAAAAESLLELGFFERFDLRPGSTRVRAPAASLTDVGSLRAGSDVLGPIAFDALFLSNGGGQAYPYRELLRTLELTETPRRLKPALVDYHGYLLHSTGGRAALDAIYGWADAAELYPMFASEYAALVRAFDQQVVARGLDGSFHYYGGEPLRTVRSPRVLGWPAPGPDGAVLSRSGPDGIYSSFPPSGARHLVLGAPAPQAPHLVQTNGRVLELAIEPPRPAGDGRPRPETPRLRLELAGAVPLALELGGLPASVPCELRFATGSVRGTTGADGSLRLALRVSTTGEAWLACTTPDNG
jgi:hypothetical protein